MQWRNQSHRPKAITVMSILQIISGIPFIIIGGTTGTVLLIISLLSMTLSFFSLMFLFLPLGILIVFVGRGLYIGKGWAWKYTIITQVINLLFPIIFILVVFFLVTAPTGPPSTGSDPGTFVISMLASVIPNIIFFVIIMSYMLRPKTRAYFGKVVIEDKG